MRLVCRSHYFFDLYLPVANALILFLGALLSMVPTVLAATFGVQNFGAKLGLLYVSFSFGGLAGPPLAGLTYDKTHSFVPMQIMTGCFWFLAGLSALALRMVSERDARRKEAEAVAGAVEGKTPPAPAKRVMGIRVM